MRLPDLSRLQVCAEGKWIEEKCTAFSKDEVCMTYTVFARKYRPQGFDEVVGQDAIVTTLKNALKQGRVAHAYLFTGPRGVGKTSLARILAKALNCQKGPTEKPCNKCDICQSRCGRLMPTRDRSGPIRRVPGKVTFS